MLSLLVLLCGVHVGHERGQLHSQLVVEDVESLVERKKQISRYLGMVQVGAAQS